MRDQSLKGYIVSWLGVFSRAARLKNAQGQVILPRSSEAGCAWRAVK